VYFSNHPVLVFVLITQKYIRKQLKYLSQTRNTMNVTQSEVNPLLPAAMMATNMGYQLYTGMDLYKSLHAPNVNAELKQRPNTRPDFLGSTSKYGPITNADNQSSTLKYGPITNAYNQSSTLKYGPNTYADFLGSTSKHGVNQITNQTSSKFPFETKYQSLRIAQEKIIDYVLKINPDNIKEQLRDLVRSVSNISYASLADFKKQYSTWDIGTALAVYEEKLRDNKDIFTLAIICCSLALLIQRNSQHKQIEKMNKLYVKSQTIIYQSVRYLKVLQEQQTVHNDNITLQKMIVNTLQTALADSDNPYSPHSLLQKSQNTHNEKNKQIRSLLTTHCEKLEEIEYQGAQKNQQIINMIVVDVMKAMPPSSLFHDSRCMFP